MQQRLNKWWAELEPKCYYFEDGVCHSPGSDCIGHWAQESQQVEVSAWRAVYGSPLCCNFYLVLGTTTKPVSTPKGVVVNDDPKGAWASLSLSCDDSILPSIQAIDESSLEDA